jgi:hypothetical protein
MLPDTEAQLRNRGIVPPKRVVTPVERAFAPTEMPQYQVAPPSWSSGNENQDGGEHTERVQTPRFSMNDVTSQARESPGYETSRERLYFPTPMRGQVTPIEQRVAYTPPTNVIGPTPSAMWPNSSRTTLVKEPTWATNLQDSKTSGGYTMNPLITGQMAARMGYPTDAPWLRWNTSIDPNSTNPGEYWSSDPDRRLPSIVMQSPAPNILAHELEHAYQDTANKLPPNWEDNFVSALDTVASKITTKERLNFPLTPLEFDLKTVWIRAKDDPDRTYWGRPWELHAYTGVELLKHTDEPVPEELKPFYKGLWPSGRGDLINAPAIAPLQVPPTIPTFPSQQNFGQDSRNVVGNAGYPDVSQLYGIYGRNPTGEEYANPTPFESNVYGLAESYPEQFARTFPWLVR